MLSIIASDLASLDSSLTRWEWVEYSAEFFVVLSCMGEYIAEFTKIKTEKWRHQLNRRSLIVLIAALAIELGALCITNGLSGKEIAVLNGIAADARKRAEDEAMARVKIEERIEHRHLTMQQREALRNGLRSIGIATIVVTSATGDSEAMEYGEELADALSQSGIKVAKVFGRFSFDAKSELSESGLLVVVQTAAQTAFAERLLELITRAGIPVGAAAAVNPGIPGIPINAIELRVCAKP
jgi:hypothetical protein